VISWALLREARRRAGLTQRELAERAGTSQAAVARIERGRQSPSLETLQRLVRACGFDIRFHLAPPDGHRDRLIDATLAMSPEERLRTVEDATRLAGAVRTA
jgi:transcriptional regulator with XRE-family HTH domain